MKTLWILAAAATFAACHNRSDETGAAPDRGGDTASVKSGYDTTKTAPAPTPADTAVKTDTTNQTVPNQLPADTTNRTVPQPPTTDTTSTTVPQNPTYDTTTTTPSANPAPGATTDTTMAPMPHDTSSMSHDSSSAPR